MNDKEPKSETWLKAYYEGRNYVKEHPFNVFPECPYDKKTQPMEYEGWYDGVCDEVPI